MNASSNPTEEISCVQRWFQAVVTHPDGVEAGAGSAAAQRLIKLAPRELEKIITCSRALSAVERLAIYANAYHTRLLECLGEVYPMLKRTLGEEAFDGFAFGYLQEYPSHSYTLNELGRRFPGYLEETRPLPDDDSESSTETQTVGESVLARDWPDFLIDLSRLEWAIYEVFDGPGVEGEPLLTGDQLLSIPPEQWAQVRLQPAPCLRLLSTRFPVNDYFTALRKAKGDDAVPIPASRQSYAALTRRDYIVRRYNLSRAEFELLEAIQQRQTVGQAIARAALNATCEMDQLAASLKLWFRNWTAEGFFQSVYPPGQ